MGRRGKPQRLLASKAGPVLAPVEATEDPEPKPASDMEWQRKLDEARAILEEKRGVKKQPVVLVKFNRSWRNYYPGRRSYGVPEELAEKLIKTGVARRVEQNGE